MIEYFTNKQVKVLYDIIVGIPNLNLGSYEYLVPGTWYQVALSYYHTWYDTL
jgi:hypothetical protein